MKALPYPQQSTAEPGHKAEPPFPAEPMAAPRAAIATGPARHGPAVEVDLSPLAHQLLGKAAAPPRPATADIDSRLSGPYDRRGRTAGRGG